VNKKDQLNVKWKVTWQ